MRVLHRWQHQFLGNTALPGQLSLFELNAFFTFSEKDLTEIQTRYKANLWVAAAIQLGALRKTGRPLRTLRIMPRELLCHVGMQLGVDAPTSASLKSIYKRRMTLFQHQEWAMAVARIARPTCPQKPAQLVAAKNSPKPQQHQRTVAPAARYGS